MSVTLFAALSSLVIFAVIIELIRRGRLREQYALLWLGTATVILVFGLWRDGLNELADALGIAYPPNALFVLALAFMLLLLLHYSTVISKLSDRSTTLTQRIAILEERLREFEHGDPSAPSPHLRDVSTSTDPAERRR
jgi:hypothetical protein